MIQPVNETLEDLLALEGVLSVRELADRLDFAGKDAGILHKAQRALRLKEEAGLRYEKIQEFRKAAFSYDRASMHASHVNYHSKRYSLRKKSMGLFERVEDYYNAGWSAVHIAESLLLMDDPPKNEHPVGYMKQASQFFDQANKCPNSGFYDRIRQWVDESGL